MTMTVEDMENAVEQSSSQEMAGFRIWFDAFDSDRLFDAAIERDACNGTLDAIADEAIGTHRPA
jgi:hypothetical protein